MLKLLMAGLFILGPALAWAKDPQENKIPPSPPNTAAPYKLKAAVHPPPEPPKALKLPTPLMASLMQYLAQRPTGETAKLFMDMQHCLQAQAINGIDEETKSNAMKACPEVVP